MNDDNELRLWWLMGHDTRTGAATSVAGVAGVAGDNRWVSTVPYHDAAHLWRHCVAEPATTRQLVDLMDSLVGRGVGLSTIAIDDPPPGVDLAGRVEAALDDVIVDQAEQAGSG